MDDKVSQKYSEKMHSNVRNDQHDANDDKDEDVDRSLSTLFSTPVIPCYSLDERVHVKGGWKGPNKWPSGIFRSVTFQHKTAKSRKFKSWENLLVTRDMEDIPLFFKTSSYSVAARATFWPMYEISHVAWRLYVVDADFREVLQSFQKTENAGMKRVSADPPVFSGTIDRIRLTMNSFLRVCHALDFIPLFPSSSIAFQSHSNRTSIAFHIPYIPSYSIHSIIFQR
jgi:hypothetical protein